MDEFRVRIDKHEVLFAAAHFITYGDSTAEPLHGHNYRVGLTVTGPLDEHSLVVDFVLLKRELGAIAQQLDHRVLLARRNRMLRVDPEDEGEVVVRCGGDRYVFPRRDVVLLDIENTTAELLARWIADELASRLGSVASALSELAVEVEESYGQSAICRRTPGD